MKLYRPFIIAAVALTIAGCGYGSAQAPRTDSPTAQAARTASPTASPSATATPQAATPGWRTYTNLAGSYSLQYPASWYQIRDPNVSNGYASSFSNENAGYYPRTTPEVGTAANVFLNVLRDPGTEGCGPSAPHGITSSSQTRLYGEQATRYLTAVPPGYGNPDPDYRIVVEAVHNNHCWSLLFDSRTQSARDSTSAIDDQIVASFKFLD